MTITETDLRRLLELDGRATAGEWRVREGEAHGQDDCDLVIVGDIFVLAQIGGPNYAHCEPNFDLIVLSRNLARGMAEELLAARSVLQRYVAACAKQNINLGGITGDAIELLTPTPTEPR